MLQSELDFGAAQPVMQLGKDPPDEVGQGREAKVHGSAYVDVQNILCLSLPAGRTLV